MRMEGRWAAGLCVWTVLLLITTYLPETHGIGCFVCSSVNGSEPDCEDTFNNTGKFYKPDCMAGRKGRSGLFPGTDCVKMKASRDQGSWTIIIRQCVVDNGDINSETEIGRSDHCGLVNSMRYDDQDVKGCVLSCSTDGCNTGHRSTSMDGSVLFMIALIVATGLRLRVAVL